MTDQVKDFIVGEIDRLADDMISNVGLDMKPVKVDSDLVYLRVIRYFVSKVNSRAEKIISKTGVAEGAHYQAMQLELEEIIKDYYGKREGT